MSSAGTTPRSRRFAWTRPWTYLQVAYPRPFDPNLVLTQMERYGDEIYWHHEMARMDGEVQIFALPLVRYPSGATRCTG